MYSRYFGLQEAPFSIAPNPHYLFMSQHHRDALAHLLYGVGAGGGFILLTGEVGTGKTTVTRCLLEQLPDNIDLAMVLNPALDSLELLATVCDELGIPREDTTPTLKSLTDKLHQFLLDNHSKGRNTVLLIDEAQHLKFDVLEQIRLLTNLETNTKKLLQIVLVGQPELTTILARPELRQLNQRITARYQIKPLSLHETETYINHRLQVAGLPAGQQLFPASVIKGVFRKTGGLPRLINVLCDRMLMGAYGQNRTSVDMQIFRQAASEVLGDESPASNHWRSAAVLAGTALFMALAGVFWWQSTGEVTAVAENRPPVTLAAELAARNESAPPAAAANKVMTADAAEVASGDGSPDLREHAVAEAVGPAPENPERGMAWSAERPQVFALLLGSMPGSPVVDLEDCISGVAEYRCEQVVARTWDEVGAYNRPAVLTLATPEKMKAYVALLGIEDTRARLFDAAGEFSMDLGEVGKLWTGEFLFLWQPPADYQGPVGIWDKGAMVSWLARKFADLDNEVNALTDDVYNRALEQRVKLFQQSVGLEADGIVGVQTLLRLNDALAERERTLAQASGPAAGAMVSEENN